jgi:hypothetical protein
MDKTLQALLLLFDANEFCASPDYPVKLLDRPLLNELFCVNPLDGSKDHAPVKPYHSPTKPRRADMNVAKFRNFIFESDTDSLEKQYEVLGRPEFSELIRLAVFSGNKSVSYIVSVADTLPFEPHTEEGVHDYKMAWSGLAAHLESLSGLKFDVATKNPSRLTRTPGIVRESTGQVQKVLHTGSMVLSDFVMSHMNNKLGIKRNKYNIINTKTYAEFEAFIKSEQLVKGLKNKLQNSYEWAGPHGMYPHILRLTLWCIDATQAPPEIVAEYMKRHTFPALLAAGYPAHKLEMGIINAYRYKGLLK